MTCCYIVHKTHHALQICCYDEVRSQLIVTICNSHHFLCLHLQAGAEGGPRLPVPASVLAKVAMRMQEFAPHREALQRELDSLKAMLQNFEQVVTFFLV